MGLNDRWFSGIGMPDVGQSLEAFEMMNRVKLEVRLSVLSHQGRGDVLITALAHQEDVPIGEAPPLASVSVKCLATRLATMDAAVIHVLYMLDGKLASNELGSAESK